MRPTQRESRKLQKRPVVQLEKKVKEILKKLKTGHEAVTDLAAKLKATNARLDSFAATNKSRFEELGLDTGRSTERTAESGKGMTSGRGRARFASADPPPASAMPP